MEKPPDSRKKVALAILGSLFLHVLLLIFFSVWMELKASQPPIPLPKDDKPVEITLIPAETADLAVAPTPPPERQTIRSDQFQEALTPPEKARFDSDRDTAAGGNKPGSGPEDMPNVEGRASGELTLQDQDVILGGRPTTSSSSAPKQKEQPTPTPAPMAEATPQPSATPAPTPEPLPDDTLAIGRSTPTPAPEAPAPQAPSAGGQFQPQTRATRIEGSLSNRGRPSLATRGTPLGRYLRQVENAIGSRWYFYIKRDAAFVAPGSFRVIFTIDSTGKVGNFRVISNTSNEGFASTCTQSIMDAEFPPIPDDVVSTLHTQRLELPFSFTIY
ncbi:MAG TPA: hypothetical protein VF585_11215 [Chthoniobacterales bacterium]|jgi:outer membrane biosynthesis protein TonB